MQIATSISSDYIEKPHRMTQLTVCVCGGGNGAHCMAGLSASRLETETRVLTLFQDESERWAKEMKHGGFFIKRNNSDNTIEQVC